MFRILVTSIILVLACQNATAASEAAGFMRAILLGEYGTAVFNAAGSKINPTFSASDFKLMGFPQPVSLTAMRNTIQDNEIKAEMQYPGPFATLAQVESVARIFGTPAVRLTLAEADKDWRIGSVTAFFGEDDAGALAEIKPGDALTVVCDSWTHSVAVALQECKLIPAFAKEFMSNPEEVLKRDCPANSSRVIAMLLLADVIKESPSSDYEELVHLISNNSLFQRTGLIADKNVKELQNKYLAKVSANPKIKAAIKKYGDGKPHVKECLSY